MVFRLSSRLCTLDSSGRGSCHSTDPLDAGGWVISSDNKAVVAQRSAVVLCWVGPTATADTTAHRVADSLEQQG